MVSQLVEEALSYCRAELDRSGIQLVVRVDSDLPAVNVDALQIEQVIVNLVRNSMEALVDAGRYDGRILVEARREGADRVVFRVQDNGPGFDPDLTDRAGTPFTTTKQYGLGLGLSLARSIIEAHGGHLTVGSTTSGATISFTLRVVPSTREAVMA
jgi:signal transduction histidine kinase